MDAMPKSPATTGSQAHAALVAAACRRIEQAEHPPALDQLAREAGLSPFHFQRVFKAATGSRPRPMRRRIGRRRCARRWRSRMRA